MLAHVKVVPVLCSAVLALALVAAPYKVTFDNHFLELHAQTAWAKDGGNGGGGAGGNGGSGGGNDGGDGGGNSGGKGRSDSAGRGSKGECGNAGNARAATSSSLPRETSRSTVPQWRFGTGTE